MRRGIYFICMGMLLFALFGCNQTNQMNSNEEELVKEAQSVEENRHEETESWQVCYKELLKKLMDGIYEEDVPFYGYRKGDEEYEELMVNGRLPVDGYFLYDIDKNDTPELIVKFGTCEADYIGHFYTFDGEKAVFIDEYGLGHSSLYTYPDGNGIIYNWGHMGYQFMELLIMEENGFGGEGIFEENINDDPDADYTPTGEIVPGAKYITCMQANQTLPMDTYDIWMKNISGKIEKTTKTNADLEETFLKTIYENGMVTGFSADGYGGDTGSCSMEEFLKLVDPYEDLGVKILRYAFVDMNEDGKEECVLRLGKVGTDEEDTSSASDQWVVLSEQDGMIYAYVNNYMFDYILMENGSFNPEKGHEYYSMGQRFLFDKEQSFIYYVDSDDTLAEAELIEY